jgi:protein gp37
MGENSNIEWCDHTFNPWRGCTKVSPGCAHCYAETLSHRNPAVLGEWGPGKPRVLASDEMWRQPLKWNAAAAREKKGTRPRVFCASLADWLDDEVPIEWLARMLNLIRLTPNLDWLLLTKRPQNWKKRVTACYMDIALGDMEFDNWCFDWTGQEPSETLNAVAPIPPANVWIGTTVEDQQRAKERIPHLLDIPAKVRFLSCEPLLQDVNLGGLQDGIHWLICGGESGPQARPMHPYWARRLRDQCASAGVPFFFKQWGNHLPVCSFYGAEEEHDGLNPDRLIVMEPSGHQVACIHDRYEFQPAEGSWFFENVGKKKAGRLLDGIEHNKFPSVKGACA